MNYIDNNYRMPRDMAAENQVLAMAFINVQMLSSVYDVETGFCNGTIFPCLDKPLAVRRMN